MSYPFFDRRQHEQVAALLSELRASRRAVADMCREAKGLPLARPPEASLGLLDHAIAELERCATEFETDLEALAARRDVKAADYRRFKLDRDIERDAATPDLFATGVAVAIAGLAETAMTAGLFFADGKMDLPSSVTYGATFAGLNIACGMFNGYGPGRWLGYRLNAPEKLPGDSIKRAAGWAGFAGITTVMGLLGLAAARVRTTGHHSGIWDFSEVGFLQTFDDYFAIGLLVTAALGGAIAFMKGRSGIKDPMIGFSEIHAQATTQLAEDADDFHEQRLDALDAIFDPAMDRLEDVADLAEEDEESARDSGRAVTGAVLAHNDKVEAAMETVRRMALEARQKFEAVHKRTPPAARLDLSAFDALIVSPPEISTVAPPEGRVDAADLIMRLQAAYDRAMAAVNGANIRFRAGITKFDLNQSEGE